MIEQLLDNNMKTIKIIFKHFPLRKHKQAKPAAYASIAADNQNKFWIYHNELFSNSKRLDDPDLFTEIAKQFDFDIDQFLKDMESQETKNKVQKDYNDGIKAGVKGVPAIFINGRRLKTPSVAAAQKIIDDELKKFGSGK